MTTAVSPLAPLLTQVQLTHAATSVTAWLERAAAQELGYAEFLQGLLEEEDPLRGYPRPCHGGHPAPADRGRLPVCRQHRAVQLPLSPRPPAVWWMARRKELLP